jgi:hypothetical protein
LYQWNLKSSLLGILTWISFSHELHEFFHLKQFV